MKDMTKIFQEMMKCNNITLIKRRIDVCQNSWNKARKEYMSLLNANVEMMDQKKSIDYDRLEYKRRIDESLDILEYVKKHMGEKKLNDKRLVRLLSLILSGNEVEESNYIVKRGMF